MRVGFTAALTMGCVTISEMWIKKTCFYFSTISSLLFLSLKEDPKYLGYWVECPRLWVIARLLVGKGVPYKKDWLLFYQGRVRNFYSSSLCTRGRFKRSSSCHHTHICLLGCYYHTRKRISCQRGIYPYPAVDPFLTIQGQLCYCYNLRWLVKKIMKLQSEPYNVTKNWRTLKSYPWVGRIIRRGIARARKMEPFLSQPFFLS